jgi:hypothetical protein
MDMHGATPAAAEMKSCITRRDSAVSHCSLELLLIHWGAVDQVWDEGSHAYYYVHKETGEASWDPPHVNALLLAERRDEELVDAPAIKPRIQKIVSTDYHLCQGCVE